MVYKITVVIVSFLFRIFFNIQVFGEFEIEEDERYVLVSNHGSLLDPLILGITFKPQISFMAKKELFKNKLFAKFIHALNAFPVDRSGSDVVALKKAVKLLREGKIVGIFIEGTRVKEYDPENAKAGPILIANMGKAKIIPVRIESTYKLFSKINIYIKEPFEVKVTKGSGEETYEEQAREVLDIIYNR